MNAPARFSPDVGRLQREIEDLRAEVWELRRELAHDVDAGELVRVRQAFGLGEPPAKFVLVLYARRGSFLSQGQLMRRMDGEGDRSSSYVRVLVHQAREKLGYDAVASCSPVGAGYALSPQGMVQIRAALEQEPPAP